MKRVFTWFGNGRGVVIFLVVLAFGFSAKAQNVYSGATGNYNAIQWYLDQARTLPFVGTPGSLQTINIGNGHSVTIPNGSVATFAGIVVHDTGASGALIFGTINPNTNSSITVSGDIIINSAGNFSVYGNGVGVVVHTLSVAGNIINNNIFDMFLTVYDCADVRLTGNNQTLGGTGGNFTFHILRNYGGDDVNVNNSITVLNQLDLATDGLMILNSTSNVTIGSGGTIVGFSATRYIQQDGSTSSGSQLIVTNNGTTAAWQIVFPIGTSAGGYTRLDLTAASGAAITTAPTANSTLAVKTIQNPSIQGQMRRQFRLAVNGNAATTTFSNADFYYNATADLSSGDVIGNYDTNWFLNVANGTWLNNTTGTAPGAGFFTAPGISQTLGNGTYFYAIGNSTAFTNVWYSYQTGVWSDPDVWTLDPSGTSLNNPLSQPPSAGDQVVILNGFTVTSDLNNLTLSTTTIQGGGTLDMAATTGHTLGTVTGSGLLRVNGVALPTGTYTSFVATTGGTIEYYNTGGNLPTTQTTYNKLLLTNSTGSNIIYVLISNLTVNGTFDLSTTGAGTVTWQINDATANQRTITLNGNLNVSAGGQVRAGSGTPATPHAMTVYGDITNSGSIKFFDTGNPVLSDANYTAGNLFTSALQTNTVNVTFSGTNSSVVTCNNQTDFYRLILNKGTGQQAVLTINSTNIANFRLFAPNNLGSTGAAPNQNSNNAFSLVNGTLELTGFITIPNMVQGGGSFPIPQNAAFWMNGANVTVQVTSAVNDGLGGNSRMFFVYGTLKVSNGVLNTGYSRGLLCGLSGQLRVEGGTINTWQLRTTNAGTGNNFAYTQSGGTVNVGTAGLSGEDVSDFPRFALPQSTTVFSMSGGTLNVATPMNGGVANTGGIMINSAASNISVTGGTINAIVPASAVNFTITSNAPFGNLIVTKAGAGAAIAILSNISCNDGTSTINQAAQPLIVRSDVTIDATNSPTFSCNGNNLTVGGNFDIQTTSTFTPGVNTITFNGSGAQSWTHNGTISGLASVVVDKTTGTILTLAGASIFPNITVALTLTSGTLADGGKTITVSGTGVLTNNATHTGTGVIDYTSTAATIGGTDGTFGNLTITTNATIATSGAQTITGTLRLISANTTLNIGSNALNALGNIYSNAAPGTAVAFSATKRILTSGFHNAGGLTRQGVAGALLFPVGTGALYTPTTINVTATTHGLTTVRPVSSEHPNVTTTGQGIRYYWRVTSSGYSGITNVTHQTYNYSSATEDNPTANYRAARFDRTTLTWGTSNTTFNATASPPIPNFSTGTAWTGVTGDQLDGEYTAGNIAAFGALTVYYSRASGNWNVNATWSTDNVLKHTGAAAASNPTSCPTCPVVIGNGAGINHTITAVAASSCGSLTLSAESILNCSTFTGHNFGTSTGGAVSGTGTLRISAVGAGVANMFPAGDFTNFLGENGGTVEWYGATKTIPAVGPGPQNLSLATYYNLVINPNAGNTITLPASNLTIYNDLTEGNAAGFTGTAITNGTRTIAITGDLEITRGTFNFSNANPSVTTLTVGGNTTVANAAVLAVQAGGTANTNTFTTPGNITNNGTINFNNTSVVNLTLTGSNNVTFGGTGSGGTTLRLVNVNKGTSQAPTVDFSVGGTITAATSGWLTLTNGTFNWNNGSTVTISSASAAYSIPPTARLTVSLGTVNVLTANNAAADLQLSGTLEVAGGIANIGTPATTIDNDIEYASAGSPTIVVSAGTLAVNGSIRRPITTLSGALVYDQSGGAVTVGGEASNNTRGVFEIDANAGSSFTLTGTSALTVQRQTNGTGYADVFINPVTSNVSSTSTIAVGLTTATTQANLRVNIAPTIGNFTVLDGNGTNIQTVNMFSNPMILGGTLSIQSPSRLVTNSLDVTIAGDLNITGTGIYTGGTNTTTFNGTGPQAGALSAGSTFTNMTINKTPGTILTLSGTSPTITNLNILNGVLNVGALDLIVIGDIVNNSSQTGAGTIQLAGVAAVTTHNITSSGGSFTNLTLAGAAATKTVNVTGNMTIAGTLNFAATDRYLNIGSSQLTFGSASAVSGAGNTAFVRTNGSDSDLGVVRNWAVGAGTFTYPVGTSTNYTPITFNLTVSVGGAGDLTVIPVNDRHPTANPSGELVLNYYWIITRGSTLNYSATGSHVYAFPAALMGGSGGTLRASYLDIASATPGWTTTGHGGTATTTSMTFTNLLNTNLPTVGNTFHYSVGTNTSGSATLPNPIIPVYSRLSDASVANAAGGGDWNSTSSWTLSSTGIGPEWGSIPFGNSVVILPGARINISQSGRKTFINQIDGLLVLSSTKVGHSFGILKGTGTMRAPTATLPAGNYTTFVSAAGGTIEYVAPMTINNRSTYNNLSIIGTGGAIMTNTDLILNGSVSIGSTAVLNNTVNNRNITMAGGWTTAAGGSFSAGTATVTFNGTPAANISGTTTFNNMAIAKTGGNITFTGTGTTTVNNTLTLTSGNLVTSSTHMISLPLAATISGGSAGSYISGPVRKVLAGASAFTFPLGSVSASRFRPAIIANTSGADTWTAEYVGADPSTGGFDHNDFNTANIQKVSMFEYWLISRLAATVADLTITYNTGSYVPNATNIGNVANLRVVRWDTPTTTWDLPPGGGTHSQSGTNVTGTVNVTNVTNFSPITFGSLDADSPLPVKWGPFSAERVNKTVVLQWIVFQELNNDHFEVERSQDGQDFVFIGSVQGRGTTSTQQEYRFVDTEASELHKYYYRIRQVDFNGAADYSKAVSVSAANESTRFWVVYPNPLKKENTLVLEQTDDTAISSEVNAIIYSAQGVLIYQGKGTLEEINAAVDNILHDARTGVYLLQISNDLTTENFRLVRH